MLIAESVLGRGVGENWDGDKRDICLSAASALPSGAKLSEIDPGPAWSPFYGAPTLSSCSSLVFSAPHPRHLLLPPTF